MLDHFIKTFHLTPPKPNFTRTPLSMKYIFMLLACLSLLTQCGKEEPVAQTPPILIAATPELFVITEAVLNSELSIETTPEDSLPEMLKEAAERIYVLIPKSLAKEDYNEWLSELIAEGAKPLLVSAPSTLSPEKTLLSINEITENLLENALISSELEQRADTLRSELKPLNDRWNSALQSLPKEAKLYGLDKELAPLSSMIPSEFSVIGFDSLSENIQQAKTKVALLAHEPKKRTTLQLEELGLSPIRFDTAALTSTSGLFESLEANTNSLEQLAKAVQSAFAQPVLKDYEHGMVDLIENYCIECHDEINEEGGVNFEQFLTESSAIKRPEFWEEVKAQVELGAMPPKKRDQLSTEEKEFFITWIDSLSERWDSGEFGADPGRTTLRRLNKNEYNYTIRDLFGIKLRPADGFPEDSGGAAGFDNNADALFLPALLMENYVEAAGHIVEAIYADRGARGRYLFKRPTTRKSEEPTAKAILHRWISLAFRRTATPEEIDKYTAIFTQARAKARTFDDAMKMPLLGLLIAPDFLYRSEVEQSQPDAYLISDFDLASRLSYFLWSSMPDPELLSLAARGELSKEGMLEQQVIRMLEDPKADSLPMHFGGQWFGWEELRSRANPDKDRYPEFTFPLRVALYKESTAFFQHLIKTNAPAYDLLQSDYAFLNETVAKHYGIPGVEGNEFRKVDLLDDTRGGVLGMGSVLVATSLPLRSSPAVRGDFILADILGTPPPDPPMNVEQLPADDQEIKDQSFREALEAHRQDPNCKSCHQIIDPLGFAMEQYDAIGRWRTTHNGHPIDASGQLPDGTAISSPNDIRKHLLKNKDLFIRNFTEKLLSYALGRELTSYDRPVVADIAKKVTAEGGNMHTIFIEVAKSYPFRHRRNDDYKPAGAITKATPSDPLNN